MEPVLRQKIRITGVVQGVGFRPWVYALAVRYGLAGFVANDSTGVWIEAEGSPQSLDDFLCALRQNPPPLARMETVETAEIPALGETGFAIHHSHAVAGENTPVPPDIATCPDCLAELFDPADRRFRYPFINCTNCGPRFTIIRDLPYDRPFTTMAEFAMCPACEREYTDPLDRRFHAQPIACPECGPRLWLEPGGLEAEAALEETSKLLRAGAIVAIKGIGGFHLACDATSDVAVLELRRRKGRAGKPFAVMARDVEAVLRYTEAGPEEIRILTGPERPIILLKRRKDTPYPLSAHVAPGQEQLGFFLPYTPLHALLLGERPLVMTSGNRSDEPIARENHEALERLAGLADAFLLHNRGIHVVCDDSVVRVIDGHEMPVRRSRGYAPLPVSPPVRGLAMLGAGGELKATFCLSRGNRAYLSQHIGDMENLETQYAYERALQQMRRLFHIEPEAVACDLHPSYLSSRWATAFAEDNHLPLMKVQHHHAHAAALMAEHALPEDSRILAVAFDGTGMGTDGAVWGGEILEAGYASFRRLGHLKYVPLPGGDTAVRKPYRMALAHLHAANLPWDDDVPCLRACPKTERRILVRQLSLGINSPPTSSAGRLFAAAASLLGLRHVVTYEAQGAMELEALAAQASDTGSYEFGMETQGIFVMDAAPLWQAMIRDLRNGVAPASIAVRFHRGVAMITARCCLLARAQTGLNTVGLTGGVFQNVLLTRMTTNLLIKDGFQVITHRLVPPNDGGLALGQAIAGVSMMR